MVETVKSRLFSQIVGEWTFGLTDTPITTAAGNFTLISHEIQLYALGYNLGHTTFNVRNSDNNIQVLSRIQMEDFLNAAHAVMEQRHQVFAVKNKSLDEGGIPDPTTGWPRRNPVLER